MILKAVSTNANCLEESNYYRRLSWGLNAGILLLYISCIYLFPRIPGIPVRVEDIFFPVFFLAAVFCLDGLSKKVIFPILIYCFYIFIGSLIGVLNNDIDIKGLSISIKEIQYFSGFLLLYSLYTKDVSIVDNTLLRISWILWIPALYGCFMVATNQIGYYGISALNEKSPSLSGQMYFSGFVLSLVLYSYFNNTKYLILALLMLISALMVGSRTAVAMLAIFLLLRAIKFNWKLFRLIIVTLLGVYVCTLLMNYYIENFYDSTNVFDRSVKRASSLFSLQDSLAPRIDSWIQHRFHSEIEPLSVLFGYGRGYENMNPDGTWRGFELNVDSQYVRDFFEIGLIGIFLKIISIVAIITSLKGRYVSIFIAYVICYAAAGVTMELFNLSKPGALFWLVAALCLVCSKFDSSIKEKVK